MTDQKRARKVATPPKGAGPAAARVWRAVLRDFELAEHELALLTQVVRTVDCCETLEATVLAEGPMVSGKDGQPRVHPAAVELRLQRLALARLTATLRVPLGVEEESGRLPRHAGARGAYGLRTVVA